MRSVTLLVLVLFVGIVIADVDVCQSTLEKVKAASRTANAWRAACEDSNWKGASCYNYWAQLNELLTIQTQQQACLTKRNAKWSAELLGNGTSLGVIRTDSKITNEAVVITSTARDTHINTVEAANRVVVSNEDSRVIAVVTPEFDSQADQTITKVLSESQNVQALETQQQENLRAHIDARTADIQSNTTNDGTQERSLVSSEHAITRNIVTSSVQFDSTSSQTDVSNEANQTNVYEANEQASTDSLRLSETSTTRSTDDDEEAQNTLSYVSEYASVNSAVQDDIQDLNADVTQNEQNDTAFFVSSVNATSTAAHADALSSLAAVHLAATQLRALYTSFQNSSTLNLSNEKSHLTALWNIINRIVVHFDLRGSVDGDFQDTNYYQTPVARGGGFETLRSTVNETLVYNEQYYGVNKVGSARYYWNLGESYYAFTNYRAAADSYRICYSLAILSY